MKVQTKITLLLLLVVAAFLAGLWAFRVYDRRKFTRTAEQRETERKESFETFLEADGEPLKTLAEYDAYWDQMVQGIAKNDEKWFGENVNDLALNGYKANAAWIYNPERKLVYSKDSEDGRPPDLALTEEAFGQLFAAEPFTHFFIKVANDIVEVRGATVHGSKDLGRQTPLRGYLFVGRLWNDEALKQMSTFSSNRIALLPPGQPVQNIRNDVQNGLIVFTQLLKTWDGKPLAQLIVRNESPFVRELNRSSERLWLAFCLFALVVLLLISSSLVRWVSHPLKKIMESLKRNDPKPIAGMCADNSEFGELARTRKNSSSSAIILSGKWKSAV